jgi:hypothetical protein
MKHVTEFASHRGAVTSLAIREGTVGRYKLNSVYP